MNSKSISALIATTVCLLGVAGCVADPPAGTFPDPALATTKEGSYPNSENLGKIEPGMTKSQVVDLLGPPHFHEWVFHVRVWNYLLHFAGTTMACQYQIVFGDDGKVVKTAWKDPACEEMAGRKRNDTAEVWPVPQQSAAAVQK
jgi:outer membrane protein assembly factor BamE (lipoprotein component of BamABCDE complex)